MVIAMSSISGNILELSVNREWEFKVMAYKPDMPLERVLDTVSVEANLFCAQRLIKSCPSLIAMPLVLFILVGCPVGMLSHFKLIYFKQAKKTFMQNSSVVCFSAGLRHFFASGYFLLWLFLCFPHVEHHEYEYVARRSYQICDAERSVFW